MSKIYKTAVSFYCKVDGVKQFREEIIPGLVGHLPTVKSILAKDCGIPGLVTDINIIGWRTRGRRSYTP